MLDIVLLMLYNVWYSKEFESDLR